MPPAEKYNRDSNTFECVLTNIIRIILSPSTGVFSQVVLLSLLKSPWFLVRIKSRGWDADEKRRATCTRREGSEGGARWWSAGVARRRTMGKAAEKHSYNVCAGFYYVHYLLRSIGNIHHRAPRTLPSLMKLFRPPGGTATARDGGRVAVCYTRRAAYIIYRATGSVRTLYCIGSGRDRTPRKR